MNRFGSVAAFSVVLVSLVGGVANAAMWPGASIQQTNIDNAVKALKGKNFNVVDTDTLDSTDPMANPVTYASTVEPLHKAIHANKQLEAALQSQSIELRNIVGVQEAANGSFTFYVQ